MDASVDLGSLKILESETGSGKTEAAVNYFFQMLESGRVRSLYFALPTRTSAVQIHRRVESYIRRRYPHRLLPVALAVPGYMDGTDKNGKLPSQRVLWDDGRKDGWFTENSKRYLAAPIAVGTIDQLLLGVIDTKHRALRWASAARSLIVVDEVHASDIYMSVLLQAAVRAHVERGGHVLLMSATLGSRLAHESLMCAKPADDLHMPSLAEAIATPYPALRTVQPGLPVEVRAFAQPERQKRVSFDIRRLMDDPEAVADLAAGHVRAGAKVLVIRNTVAACNAVHRALERILGADGMVTLPNGVTAPHHGRFAPPDRRVLDQAIEAAFGKGSPSRGTVMCTTQTAEQSLDIDADILITDLCPMDVMLQRIGRLHRHAGIEGKSRPEGYANPVAVVLEPDHSVVEFTKKPANGIGIERAYADVRVVHATLELLRERGSVVIPQDNRELVERATHPEILDEIERNVPGMREHAAEVMGIGYASRDTARLALRNEKWRPGDPLEASTMSRSLSTRLGLNDVELELKTPFKSFGKNFVTHIKISSWQFPAGRIELDSVVEAKANPDGSVSISIAGESFIYGRCGLEKGRFDDVESAGR